MEFQIETDERLSAVDVTEHVKEAIPETIDVGCCIAFARHTTTGLIVQENEPRLRSDIETFLAGLVPDDGHAHDEIDGNADAHLRATMIGPSVTVPIENGDLELGTWQSIILVECDGPRTRTVSVTAIPGADGPT